jgi:hypothetical protein
MRRGEGEAPILETAMSKVTEEEEPRRGREG